MAEIEYLRYGHIDGKLVPWLMRVWCQDCGFESEPVKQGGGHEDEVRRARDDHNASCPIYLYRFALCLIAVSAPNL